jgi:hypothetical protein
MKHNLPSPAPRHNRRTFIKTQAVIGIGALTAGMVFPQACDSSNNPKDSGSSSPDELRTQYQSCLGGPFPEPVPLNFETRETIQNDGYRIESLTYEVLPGERVPALLLIRDIFSQKQCGKGQKNVLQSILNLHKILY